MLKSTKLFLAVTCLLYLNTMAENLGMGSIFISGDIITQIDSSAYKSSAFIKRDTLWMYDRKTSWGFFEKTYIYESTFADGQTVKVGVNPEFTRAQANAFVEEYMLELGRIPEVLRHGIREVWIHSGSGGFGGLNGAINIQTDLGQYYKDLANSKGGDGIIAETLIHEAVHAVLDKDIYSNPEYKTAQNKDGIFLNDYAETHPTREDAAESFLVWMICKYRSGRIPAATRDILTKNLSNRFEFFDKQNYNMAPFILPKNNDGLAVINKSLYADSFYSNQEPKFNFSHTAPEGFVSYFDYLNQNSVAYLPLKQDRNTTAAIYKGEDFDLQTDAGGKLSMRIRAGINGKYSGKIELRVFLKCDDGTKLMYDLPLEKNLFTSHDLNIPVPVGPRKITTFKLLVRHAGVSFNQDSTLILDYLYLTHERGYANNLK